jgi:hypothetical protein
VQIFFDQHGDGNPDVAGRKGWRRDSHDHIKNEVVAKKLLEKAANALAQEKKIEVQVWCSAVKGSAGAGVLWVYKGLHEQEGPSGEILHLTMGLKTPDSKPGSLITHTLFHGAFHLYAKVVDSDRNKSGYRLQPVRLSYQAVQNSMDVDRPMSKTFVRIDILNAGSVSSEMGSIG